jgi:hypothetical protein
MRTKVAIVEVYQLSQLEDAINNKIAEIDKRFHTMNKPDIVDIKFREKSTSGWVAMIAYDEQV